MQEMNCIRLSRPDYPAISSSVFEPTQAPDLKNSRDTAPIVVSLCANNALPLPCAAEHNLPQAGQHVEKKSLRLTNDTFTEMRTATNGKAIFDAKQRSNTKQYFW